GDALKDLVDNYGVTVRQLPDDVITALRTKTAEVLSSTAAGDPLFAKVLKSFKDFQTKHDKWANSSERQYAVRVRGG
ncbi:MAG: ABC transporter substrate-binding protein, partial [Alphaproteobacteria bacterium]|nr:ABC transporter substrate-binding protein [Alphaproteobacteria bacterium]